jgi:hypothetical protein
MLIPRFLRIIGLLPALAAAVPLAQPAVGPERPTGICISWVQMRSAFGV